MENEKNIFPEEIIFGKSFENQNKTEENSTEQSPVQEEEKQNQPEETETVKEVNENNENNEKPEEQLISLSKNKLEMLKKIAHTLRDASQQLYDILGNQILNSEEERIQFSQITPTHQEKKADPDKNQIIEGIFNGEKMVSATGKQYDVPVNYASKSKLVEGDMLKLIITERGTFVYKQTKPVERTRVIGILSQGPTGEYYVSNNDRRWRVLNASVTYYKGEVGDEVIILIPQEGYSKWAAVENIIKKS